MVEACHLFPYDWVIPNFLESMKKVQEDPDDDLLTGPNFFVKYKVFYLNAYIRNEDNVEVYLTTYSYEDIKIKFFSLSLVGEDQSEMHLSTFRKVTMTADRTFPQPDGAPDAVVRKIDLGPNLLPNGQLRIRCRLEIEYSEELGPPPTLAQDLKKEMDNLSYTDFTMVCGDREFQVHRFLLASRSSVFKAMFVHEETLEAKTGRADIKDIQPEAFATLIKFIYTDTVSEVELTPEVLAAADQYDIPVLIDRCLMHLSSTLTTKNAAEYFLLGYFHNSELLKYCAARSIIDNYTTVKETPEFGVLLDQYPKALEEIDKLCKR